jgi:hypothetical protein
MLGLVCTIALTIGFGVFFNSEQPTVTAYAANTTLNVSETRIDGWRAVGFFMFAKPARPSSLKK